MLCRGNDWGVFFFEIILIGFYADFHDYRVLHRGRVCALSIDECEVEVEYVEDGQVS